MRTAYCLLLLFVSSYAYGCFCDASLQPPLCQQMRTFKDGALFVGVVIDRRIEKVKLDEKTSVKQQVVTLAVQDGFFGVQGKTVRVKSFVDPGMCGYPFKMGASYFVEANLDSDGSLYVNSCGMTKRVERAADNIRFLRALRDYPEGALVFGTVKKYVGVPNFVSLENLPIAGTQVTLHPDNPKRHTQTATVNSDGWYQFAGLTEGAYFISATLPNGYTRVVAHHIELQPIGCSQVDFRAHATDANGVVQNR